MSEAAAKPRVRDTWWWLVLERFGLPTLLVLYLLFRQDRWTEQDRKERHEVLEQLRRSIDATAAAVTSLAAAERAHADAVTATWPHVAAAPKPPRLAAAPEVTQ